MRILLVLGTSAGGVGRHVHGLTSALVAGGHSVVVACPPEVEDRFGFAGAGARHVPLTVTDRPHPLRDLRAMSTLGDLLRHADVVHAHGLRAGALAALAATGSQVPVVVTLHNAAPGGRVTARLYAVLERVVARRATCVLGVSDDLVQRMADLRARVGGLAVIPGPPPPTGTVDAAAVRDDLGVPPGQVLAVVVARLAPQKGLHLLLDAVALVRDLPLAVVVAGDGPQRQELQERISREGLPVRLLGHRGDVPALCAAADLVVSSAVWEGQPINLQEALHAGAAIVATDVGGSAAVLGDAAVLVPGGDSHALAHGIRLLVTDEGERARRRALSRRQALTLPTEADAVVAALEVYESVT
ncbi:glycosyltransferase [Knoellia sp. p5-6-4]|uniref:glycosyltransferase n=1 Tax=unclassified Knoellia TaxID=2618719 RepID=UPI0023DC66ED|nr:glycosyltransferase [Knoellia sp. p5-6-4]MDF2145874.1 glycosyltransferase [Knoellia sp. p5-6-4]